MTITNGNNSAAAADGAFLDDLYARKDEFLRDDRYRSIADADEFFSKIVGVSFEGRQSMVAGLRPGDRLQMVREPDNVYDANAIAVRFGDLHVGYIRKQIAVHLAPHMDAGRRYAVEVGSITGGGERHVGVNVRVRRVDFTSPQPQTLPAGDRARSFPEIQSALLGDRPLRESQIAVIERVLAGKRTLAVLGTGRGKSVCFQLPAAYFALHDGRKTVVMYPLRALANDQFEALLLRLAPLGIRIFRANGALDAHERSLLNEALQTGSWDMILTTPEYVQFHGDRFAQAHNRPGLVVVDEAHHVYEARHRPAYRRIGDFLRAVGSPAVLALTATARTDCFAELRSMLELEAWVIDPTVRENLAVVDARNTKDRLAYLKREIGGDGKAIIYCNSRSEATKVAELLRPVFPDTAFYHAGVGNTERLEIESRFRSGALRVVVATSAFGEGIDLPDVRNVVLYHLNFNFTEFNQQAGRAGRDGADARIHLLYGEADRRINDFIIGKTAPTITMLRSLYRGMRGLCDHEHALRMSWADISRTLELDRADETTVAVAARIFADAGLVEITQDDDGRVIRFAENPPKVDIAATPRFAEGEAERETFERFCRMAMYAEAIDLERIINRPIYPDGVPLIK